jgi:uncharacterized protein (DUF1330 family)
LGEHIVAAYVVLFREGPVKDPAAMEEYQRLGRARPRAVNLTPLVVYGAQTPLEGEAPDGVVVLKFDSTEDAKAWYYSPAYQEAVVHRLKAADYRGVIVEGL